MMRYVEARLGSGDGMLLSWHRIYASAPLILPSHPNRRIIDPVGLSEWLGSTAVLRWSKPPPTVRLIWFFAALWVPANIVHISVWYSL